MARKTKNILLAALGAFVLVIAVLLSGLLPLNLFFLKSSLANAVRENAGVELSIAGPLRIRLGTRPRINANGIEIKTLDASPRSIAQLEHLEVGPRMLDLMRGDLHFRSLDLAGIELDHCALFALPSGKVPNNGQGEDGALPSIAVDRLTMEGLDIGCAGENDRPGTDLRVSRLQASAPKGGRISIDAEGEMRDLPYSLQARLGGLRELTGNAAEFPLKLYLSVAETTILLDGAVARPLTHPRLTAAIELQVPDPSTWFELFEIEAVPLGPIELSGHADADAGSLTLDGMAFTLGRTQARFDAAARRRDGRPLFELDAKIARFDIEPVTQFFPPETGAANSSEADTRSLQPLFGFLDQFDAGVRLKIDQLLNSPLAIDDLQLAAGLANGILDLEEAALVVEGNPVTAQASLDLRADCPRLSGRLEATGADVQTLAGLLNADLPVSGTLERLSIETDSCGDTATAQLQSLLANLQIEVLEALYEDRPIPLKVDRLWVEVGWRQAGTLSLDAGLVGEPLHAQLETGSLESMLHEPPLPFELTARGAGAMLQLTGRLNPGAEKPELNARFDVQVPQLGSLHRWAEVDPQSRLAFSANGSILLSDAGISIEKLDARLGQSDLQGSLTLPTREGVEARPPATIHLRSSQLNLPEITDLHAPEAADEPSTESQPERKAEQTSIDLQAMIADSIDLPSADVDIQVNRLDTGLFDLSAVELQGQMRRRRISDARLTMNLEDIRIEGGLEMDIGRSPGQFSYVVSASDVDLGRVLQKLDLADDLQAHAKRVDFNYSSSGDSLLEISRNAHFQAEIGEFAWQFEDEAGGSTDIRLDLVTVSAEPGLFLNWKTRGMLNGVPVKIWIQSPPLLKLFDDSENLPLTVVFGSGKDVAMGRIDIHGGRKQGLTADLSLSGERMEAEEVDFSQLQPPLADYRLESNLEINDNGYFFTGLEAQLGSSSAQGHLNVTEAEGRKSFVMSLQAPVLEIDDLIRLSERWHATDGNITPEKIKEDAGTAGEQGFLPIINAEIDALTEHSNFDVRINVAEVRSRGDFLGAAQVEAFATETELRLKPLRIELPGGGVDADYTAVTSDDGVNAALNIHIDRMHYGDVLRLLKPDSEARGLMYLDTSLTAESPDIENLAGAMDGHFDLVMFPEDAEAGFLDLWAGNLVLALLPKPDSAAESKRLNCMVARFDVEDGVMQNKELLLDSTDVIVRGRGSIDLGRQELDLLFAPQAKLEKFLSVSTPIAVTGPFNDFQVGVATGGFVATMLRWYYGLIYVPWKWLTGERFPADGLETCFNAMDWELTDEASWSLQP
jgi:uncharacterized protein involved in outer membrane biogenesis